MEGGEGSSLVVEGESDTSRASRGTHRPKVGRRTGEEGSSSVVAGESADGLSRKLMRLGLEVSGSKSEDMMRGDCIFSRRSPLGGFGLLHGPIDSSTMKGIPALWDKGSSGE